MSNSKVQCRCCGKMMVPTVVRSRGLWISWGVRLDGHISGNVCPFCLSENWDGGQRPQHRSMGQKSLLLFGLIFGFLVVCGLFKEMISVAGINHSAELIKYAEWSFVIGAILIYRKYRHK